MLQDPPVAVAEPICVVPSNSFTSELTSAVPTIFGVLLFVVREEFVILGAAGGVVSTVIVIEPEEGDVLLALFVAVAVMVLAPSGSADVATDQAPEVFEVVEPTRIVLLL